MTRSWRGDVTGTCLVCLIWVNSCRFIWLPNLIVTGLIEMEISILILIITWISWKNWTHCLDPPYCEIFKIRNDELQFQSPGYDWEKNKKTEQTIAKHHAFHADAVMSFDINLDQKSIRYQKFWHIQRLKMCLKFKTKGL